MEDMAIDPVCGMEVDPKIAEYQTTYQGKTYYFCSAGCKQDFDKEPKKYMKEGPQPMGHGSHHH